MAKVGQMCTKCKKDVVRLNQHDQPQCQNARCLALFLPEPNPEEKAEAIQGELFPKFA